MSSLTLIRKHYQITLPEEIRKSFHYKVGDFIEFVMRGSEVILKPKALIDKDQMWFWTREWQEGEKTAQEDIQKGRVKKFSKVEDLLEDLDK